MRNILIFFTILLIFSVISITAQQHQGCIVAGWTMSFTHGPAGGDIDLLVYRLDTSGNILWQKNFGGALPDEYPVLMQFDIENMISTSDGGYLLMGSGQSYTNGATDFLIYKLDAAGNKLWRKNYGGINMDIAMLTQQTPDGGFLLVGLTNSYTHGPPGSDSDMLLYKIDGSGNKQWRKNYGGYYTEFPTALVQTSDGGLLLAGYTGSYTHGPAGTDSDLLIYKLDVSGRKQWRKNYGGTYTESHFGTDNVKVTADGGILLWGVTQSYVHGTPGSDADFLIYKLDTSGNKQWRKNYGGASVEYPSELYQTADGGIVTAGLTSSYVTGPPAADSDFLVYRLDSKGKKLWRKNYGGMYPEGLSGMSHTRLFPTADGGSILAGMTMSFGSFPGSMTDALVYKLDASGKKQWRKNYGGALYEVYVGLGSLLRIIPTADGGYLMATNTNSYTHGYPGSDVDFLVYKLDAGGGVQWWNFLGGIHYDFLTSLLEVTN